MSKKIYGVFNLIEADRKRQLENPIILPKTEKEFNELRNKLTQKLKKEVARLNKERQDVLEPKRVSVAVEKLNALGIIPTFVGENRIDFIFKEHNVSYFPYSGWHTGKSIKDGRGLDNLLKKLK